MGGAVLLLVGLDEDEFVADSEHDVLADEVAILMVCDDHHGRDRYAAVRGTRRSSSGSAVAMIPSMSWVTSTGAQHHRCFFVI